MNNLISEYYPLFKMYQSLRRQLMELLQDDDLAFNPGGYNVSLGRLCEEIGEVQQSYIQSFQTFKQDFNYRQDDPAVKTRVARLQSWYADLDRTLKKTLEGLSEEDLVSKRIDRGGDFELSPRIQLEVYKEALLIFYGKASVYLKMLEKELPAQWREWIA